MTIAVTQASPSYLKLVRKFPLRVIGSEAQYDAAIAIIQRLAVRGEEGLDAGEADYLYALTSLVETYENEHYPIGPDGLRPHERLKWLAKQAEMSQADLAKLLEVSQPLVSLMLLGKRELTVAHIRRLSEHFHINPRYFMA
ncbi:MAG: helix-turn-helix domain-containing protein [Tepidisphaeraceae bacterium]|jgi:HTH-type transcriptional regulator / antitoxin HigA